MFLYTLLISSLCVFFATVFYYSTGQPGYLYKIIPRMGSGLADGSAIIAIHDCNLTIQEIYKQGLTYDTFGSSFN